MKKKMSPLIKERAKRQKQCLTNQAHRIAVMAAFELAERGWEKDEIGDVLCDAIASAARAIVTDLGTNGEIDPATGWWTEASVRKAIDVRQYAADLTNIIDRERQTA